jgi:hypothetical protein
MMDASPHPFTYLAKRSDGSWKIGFTDNPLERPKGLRSANPGIKFEIVRVWQRRDAYRVEQLVKRIMRPHVDLAATGWETFKASRKAMLAAFDEAIRIADHMEVKNA